MMKIYILYLFLILFILPAIVYPPIYRPKIFEGLQNKKDDKKDKKKDGPVEKQVILKRDKDADTFSFRFEPDEITISPSNKSEKVSDMYFFYFSSPSKTPTYNFKFNEVNTKEYKLDTPKDSYKILTEMQDEPLNIIVNDHDYEFKLQKASSGHSEEKEKTTYNIVHFQKAIGNVIILKKLGKLDQITLTTTLPEIYESVGAICAILTGFMIIDKINSLDTVDYDAIYKKKMADKEKKKQALNQEEELHKKKKK